MRQSSIRHALAFVIGEGQYGWPVCFGTRGPVNLATGRLTEGQDVTCLKCLDHLTRP
jgi:hypothetical protein